MNYDTFEIRSDVRLLKKTELTIKAIVSLMALIAISIYAWLNIWIGLDTIMLLVVGLGVNKLTSLLMARLGARMAPQEKDSLREGFTTRTFHWTYTPFYAISILLIIYVIFTGFSSGTLGWRNASIAPELALGVAVSLWSWTRNIGVSYISFNKSRVSRRQSSPGPATTAVLVVHGIGSQKAGEPLHSIANPIEHFLYKQSPVQVSVRNRDGTGSYPPYSEFLYEIKGKGRRAKQKVIITEVLWADTAHRPSGLKTFGWFLWSLPMLIALAFAPDRYDLEHGNTARLAYRIVFPAVLILSVLQPSMRLWALIAVLVIVSTTVFPKTNLLGDVQMAATTDREVARIVSKINTAIDTALTLADRVVIVGHSQGGYLSYIALKERVKKENIQLIGVGSGLKPIWTLKHFNDRRSISRAWLLIIGSLSVFISLIPEFLGYLAYEKPDLVDWMSSAALSLSDISKDSPFHPVPVHWGFTTKHLESIVPDRWQIGMFILGMALVILTRRKLAFVTQPRANPLPLPQSARHWTEITSSIDSVGRLAFPHLFDADVWNSPSYGNPLLDHISYFRENSPVTWYLTCYLFAPIMEDAMPGLRRWAQYLDIRIWRARVFSTILGLLLIGVYSINRVNPAIGGMRSLTAQISHPGYVFISLLGIALISPVLAIWDRWKVSSVIAERPIKPPPSITRSPAWVRNLIFAAWGSAAAFAAGISHHLIRYSPMTAAEVRILPVAPIMISILLFGVAAALSVGYYFRWLMWVTTLCFLYYLGSYLPGEGQVYLFLDLFIFLVAIFSIAGISLFARPIELSDSEWPGYYAAST